MHYKCKCGSVESGHARTDVPESADVPENAKVYGGECRCAWIPRFSAHCIISMYVWLITTTSQFRFKQLSIGVAFHWKQHYI